MPDLSFTGKPDVSLRWRLPRALLLPAFIVVAILLARFTASRAAEIATLPNPLEQHAPLQADYRDKTSPVWDMSQERAYIENLLAQRFNFFLVFFSIVMAGSVNAKTQHQLQIVLGIGSAICILFALVLARSQEKLDLCLAD